MTCRLKSETVSKKIFTRETFGRTNFQCTLLYLNSERVFETFEELGRKNGRDGASCGGKWLLNRILHTAGIYSYLTYERIHLKESSVIMFLVVSEFYYYCYFFISHILRNGIF